MCEILDNSERKWNKRLTKAQSRQLRLLGKEQARVVEMMASKGEEQ